jgi:hypothetical protein
MVLTRERIIERFYRKIYALLLLSSAFKLIGKAINFLSAICEGCNSCMVQRNENEIGCQIRNDSQSHDSIVVRLLSILR